MEKYNKIKILGTGSFGSAWLVFNNAINEKCVIKEISISSMQIKDKDAAINEVKILSTLRHKNIIRYKEAFLYEKNLCISMEYADDGDLFTKIKNQKGKLFLELQIIDWFVQILIAVKYIHSLHILHRDLKSQNLFLTRSGLIKVGDFGISRYLYGSAQQAHTTIGTPYYLSPEICQQKSYNNKSDMWSLGVLLYELATLKHPFRADDFSNLVVKIIKGKFTPISSCYGPLLQDLVLILLQVDPDERPSASQLLKVPALQPHIKTYLLKVKHKEEPVILEINSGDKRRCRRSLDLIGSEVRYQKNKVKTRRSLDSFPNRNLDKNEKVKKISNIRRTSLGIKKNIAAIKLTAGIEGNDSVFEPRPQRPNQIKKTVTPNSSPPGDAVRANIPKYSPKVNFIERNKTLAGTPPCKQKLVSRKRDLRLNSHPSPKTKHDTVILKSSNLVNVNQEKEMARKQQQSNACQPNVQIKSKTKILSNVRKRAASLMNLNEIDDSRIDVIPFKMSKRSLSAFSKNEFYHKQLQQLTTHVKLQDKKNPDIIVDNLTVHHKNEHRSRSRSTNSMLGPKMAPSKNVFTTNTSTTNVKKYSNITTPSSLQVQSLSPSKSSKDGTLKCRRRLSVGLPQGSHLPEGLKSQIAGRLRAASVNSNIDATKLANYHSKKFPLKINNIKEMKNDANLKKSEVLLSNNEPSVKNDSKNKRNKKFGEVDKKHTATYTVLCPAPATYTVNSAPSQSMIIRSEFRKIMGDDQLNNVLELLRTIKLSHEELKNLKKANSILNSNKLTETGHLLKFLDLVLQEN